MDIWQKSCTMHCSEWKTEAELFKFIVNSCVMEAEVPLQSTVCFETENNVTYGTLDYKHHNWKHKNVTPPAHLRERTVYFYDTSLQQASNTIWAQSNWRTSFSLKDIKVLFVKCQAVNKS